ncbi:MAG: glycosyltransferase family 4 protein [Deltaproteobacteria bacterium]|nr:glycosyltransferase family 4 protein [Deltaproteobacteria bacterium]
MTRKKIKVFYLINSMALGGAERQMAELVRRLPKDRFEAVLCSLGPENGYPNLLPAGQPRYVAEGRLSLGLFKQVRGWIEQENPDIVHSFMEYASLFNRLVSPGPSNPIVITSVRSRMMHPKYRLIEAWLARRCDMIVVNSVGTRDELIKWQRVPADKVRVIPNIVAFERFGPRDEETRTRLREELNLCGPTFLLPGRISLSKHQFGLAAAVGRLKKRGLLPDNSTFLLAGRVYASSVERVLPAWLGYTGTQDTFRYLGKVKQMADLYSAVDWVVLPSLWEGLPNVALEAHACERPLLVSHAANLDRIVKDCVTGFEFRSGWVQPMAAAIKRALETDRPRALEMGRLGRQRVLSMFDPEHALEQVTKLYDELLMRRRRG